MPGLKLFTDITNKVLIIGDVMLDEYWYGDCNRISPEAPVPVLTVQKREFRLGGAANVAANLNSLGGKLILYALAGLDSAGDQLVNLINKLNISTQLVREDCLDTITKLRIISKHQQLMRLDHESKFAEHLAIQLSEMVEQQLSNNGSNIAALVISDYAKGTVVDPQKLIIAANKNNIKVIIDPKGDNYAKYNGAWLLTPNLTELQQVVGTKVHTEAEIERYGRNLLAEHNIYALAITRGEHGMTLLIRDEPALHLPAQGGDVFDVTGAGDTVVAVIAAAVASNYSLMQAARIAMVAAGIAVGKVGTATVTLSEIMQKLQQMSILATNDTNLNHVNNTRSVANHNKIMSRQQILDAICIAKDLGEKIVFVNGCYDVLHFGHIRYLERARRLGDRLVVGINDDLSVKRLKGDARPIHSLEQRMEVLSSLKPVDWVLSFAEDTPLELIKQIQPDILVKTDEHYASIADIPDDEGKSYVLQYGGEVHLLRRTPDCSSSQVIKELEDSR